MPGGYEAVQQLHALMTVADRSLCLPVSIMFMLCYPSQQNPDSIAWIFGVWYLTIRQKVNIRVSYPLLIFLEFYWADRSKRALTTHQMDNNRCSKITLRHDTIDDFH